MSWVISYIARALVLSMSLWLYNAITEHPFLGHGDHFGIVIINKMQKSFYRNQVIDVVFAFLSKTKTTLHIVLQIAIV